MTGPLCPLWGEPLVTPPITARGAYLVYSPRAGGMYGLTGRWGLAAEKEWDIPELRDATPRQKANLSHWIYRQNLEAGLLVPPPESARHNIMAWESPAEMAPAGTQPGPRNRNGAI